MSKNFIYFKFLLVFTFSFLFLLLLFLPLASAITWSISPIVDVNSSIWWAGISGFVSPFLFKNGFNLDFNTTFFNGTYDLRYALTGVNATTNISINYGRNQSSGTPIVFELSPEGKQKWSFDDLESNIWGENESLVFEKPNKNVYFNKNISVGSIIIRQNSSIIFDEPTAAKLSVTKLEALNKTKTIASMDVDFVVVEDISGTALLGIRNDNLDTNSSIAISASSPEGLSTTSIIKWNRNYKNPYEGGLVNFLGQFQIRQKNNENDSMSISYYDSLDWDEFFGVKGFFNETKVVEFFNENYVNPFLTKFYYSVLIDGTLDMNNNNITNIGDAFFGALNITKKLTGNFVSKDYDVIFNGKYGIINIGEVELGVSNNVVGDLNVNGSMIFNNPNGDSNIKFMFSTRGNDPRFVIPKEGLDLAIYNSRSMMVGGDMMSSISSSVVNCSSNNYTFLDCDTGGTGQDLGLRDTMQIGTTTNEGELYITQTYNFSNDKRLGVQGNAEIIGNLNVTGNLTLGQKIIFALGETIDNIVDGWITITGSLNVTGNITADYINGKSFVAKYHRTAFINSVAANTWYNISLDTSIATESTIGYTLVDNNESVQTNFDGIVRVSGCIHPFNNNANPNTANIYSRILVDGIEARCTQRVEPKEFRANEISTIEFEGTIRVNSTSKIQLQYRVDNTDIDLNSSNVFDNPVAASINFEKISD